MNKYDDIINLERPISKKRMCMSRENRSAQFAPFSALIGYEDAVKEQARLTDKKKNLTDEMKETINEKLMYIKDNIDIIGIVSVNYFVNDKKKNGGCYRIITDKITRIDSVKAFIIFSNGFKINFDDIVDVNCEEFNNMKME